MRQVALHRPLELVSNCGYDVICWILLEKIEPPAPVQLSRICTAASDMRDGAADSCGIFKAFRNEMLWGGWSAKVIRPYTIFDMHFDVGFS